MMHDFRWSSLAPLALGWLIFFALHSTLASLALKRWVAARRPRWLSFYRLGFNLFAVLSLLPVLWLSYRAPGPLLWHWQGAAAWLANGLALAALAGIAHSARSYDMRAFFGLAQLRSRTVRAEDGEPFRLSWYHRFVRHPWYFFALVLIWTRDMSAATLLSSLMMSLYFLIGSRLEERKLLVFHGATYRRYMARVPGLIPLPWRSLSAREAAELRAGAGTGFHETDS